MSIHLSFIYVPIFSHVAFSPLFHLCPFCFRIFFPLSMGMISGNEQEKSQLAKEICELSARATACANLHHRRTNKSPFINWYLVIKVDENADTCSIRKQYHKLALQLHPDKNSNSTAETAFKLLSEAYFCLSDSTRRRAFDRERNSVSCINCNPKSYKETDHPINTNVKFQKACQETSRYSRRQTRIRELRNKLAEDATIIERCLIANAALRKAHGTTKETPIFEPSDYQHRSFPHHRTASHKRLEDARAAISLGSRSMNDAAKLDDYPIFQHRSETVASMSKCAIV